MVVASTAGLMTLLKLGSDVSGLVTGINQSMEIFQKFENVVKKTMAGVVNAAKKGVDAIVGLMRQIQMLSAGSAKLDSMRDSFNKMAAQFGATGQNLLASMQQATLGMTKQSDLIQSSMTAMMLINKRAMGDVTETLPMFAKIATSAARALGEDVSFMYDSLVRGIGRASPMILDNLGFTIKLSEVYGAYAAELGKTVKQLNVVERQIALVNEVMRQGAGYVENLGISTGGLATKQKQLATVMADLKDTIGQAFMPMTQALQMSYNDLAITVIDKLIPAFRTLGRVLSEVFGTKNPFMRWIEGDPAKKTAERIAGLEESLVDLQNLGPNFAGTITDAEEKFAAGLAKLDEKYAPKFAKIQKQLVDRVAKIWDNFNRRQKRQKEDRDLEDRRRLVDHQEKMRDIRERYDGQIADAIRKRDARALLNALRQYDEEETQAEEAFEKDESHREEDRGRQDARAKEDAKRAEAEAVKSAEEQMLEVRKAYAKEWEKLNVARLAAVSAAEAAWKAETDGLREQIHTQKKLIAQQIIEESKLRREFTKPLPPIWQKFQEVLTWVWDKISSLRDLVLAFLQDPETSLENMVSPKLVEKIEKIKKIFGTLWKVIKLGAKFLGDMFGPEIKELWSEIMLLALEFLKIFKELLPVFAVFTIMLIPAIIFVTMLLKGLFSAIAEQIKTFRVLLNGLRQFIHGWLQFISGFFTLLQGLFTGNKDKIILGLVEMGRGVLNVWRGFTRVLMRMVTGFFRVVWAFFEGFLGNLISGIKNFVNKLIGNSIIPDMFAGILGSFPGFFTDAWAKWREGWNGFIDILKEIWAVISQVVTTATTSVGLKIGSWVEGIGTSVSKLFNPIQNVLSKIGKKAQPEVADTGTENNNWFNLNNWNIFGGGGNMLETTREVVYDTVADVVNTATEGNRGGNRR